VLIAAHVSKLSSTKEEKISQLRILVEWLLIDIFMEGIDRIIDETGCKFAKRKPNRKGTGYELEPACVQRKKECDICEFWSQHESELRAIAAALKSTHRLDKSQQRMLARIEKVLDFGMIRARGFRSCRALSDAVIATEMPRTATLMTTNKRHFELLCSALEKKLFN
jgi:acetolactate synthase regulatory subunit